MRVLVEKPDHNRVRIHVIQCAVIHWQPKNCHENQIGPDSVAQPELTHLLVSFFLIFQ